ncbi:GNAT family N-acetyltransferase [Novosphingobium profundi]|uniref:acyl-homoserine-lactone synthase n=1 Tax=Novosphingobium profundi TaxID=1774954 RepID=UPI001BDB5680|nr:acyl-homoserine-lactone synthase [Novosphingobium profundi]MBT0670627.1 GNAT family N-acetyltransferase [Novosphingobium profundi]
MSAHAPVPSQPVPDALLRAMFEARKSVFVDLLKWDVPVLEGRYEIDQFDDSHARYVIVADRQGRHLGSARLLETERPHLLSSFYAPLCEGPVPQGPAIREVTRFCLDRRLRAAERRVVRNALVHGLVDHALQEAISAFTAIAALGWFQQILAFGWTCRPLGLPTKLGGETLGALRIEIGPETPALLERAGIDRTSQSPDLVHYAA